MRRLSQRVSGSADIESFHHVSKFHERHLVRPGRRQGYAASSPRSGASWTTTGTDFAPTWSVGTSTAMTDGFQPSESRDLISGTFAAPARTFCTAFFHASKAHSSPGCKRGRGVSRLDDNVSEALCVVNRSGCASGGHPGGPQDLTPLSRTSYRSPCAPRGGSTCRETLQFETLRRPRGNMRTSAVSAPLAWRLGGRFQHVSPQERFSIMSTNQLRELRGRFGRFMDEPF